MGVFDAADRYEALWDRGRLGKRGVELEGGGRKGLVFPQSRAECGQKGARMVARVIEGLTWGWVWVHCLSRPGLGLVERVRACRPAPQASLTSEQLGIARTNGKG